MKYRDSEGNLQEIYLPPTGDTLPIGSIVDYDGNTVPVNWKLVEDSNAYSTNEVKTDKVWIDGKPIYRKTFERGNSFSSFEHGIENIEHIWVNDEFTFRQHDSGNHISLNASSSGTYVYANVITVEIKNTGAISAPYVFITLEYTKTTD